MLGNTSARGASASTSKRHSSAGEYRRLFPILIGLVDAGLAGVILVLPFVMGGRQAIGQLLLCTLAMLTALVWLIAQCLRQEPVWRSSRAEMLILGGALLLLVQLLPWPHSVLSTISPKLAESLPLWNAPTGPNPFGNWTRVSLTPSATQRGIAIFGSYAVLFLVVFQRIAKRDDIERLLKLIALGATSMAAFGLVQYYFGNGQFFWFYEHPQTTTNFVVKGAFTNRNHFAQFLALGIGPLMWCAFASRRSLQPRRSFGEFGLARSSDSTVRRICCLVALSVVMFAVLMSLSRAGIVVMGLAFLVASGIYFRGGLLGRWFLISSIGVVSIVAILVALNGGDLLSERVNQLSSGSLEELDHGQGRRRVWNAVLRATADFPLLGTGVGSHRDVYPKYLDRPIESDYTHAECSYLQIAEETGGIGACLAMCGLATCGVWCWGALRNCRTHHLCGCCGAVMAGLVANVLHATVDCVWYVPACMAVIVILAACVARLYQLSRPDIATKKSVVSRFSFAAMAVIVAVAGIPLVRTLIDPAMSESHWHQYVLLTKTSSATDAEGKNVTPRGNPALSDRCAEELQQVLSWSPDHARARLALATICLEQFAEAQKRADSNQTLIDLRDAALASRFSSPTAVKSWLEKVVGPNATYLVHAREHSRRALRDEPFLGTGYLYLSELCFLECPDSRRVDDYLAQAAIVRPLQATVLFEAGNRALAVRDAEKATAYWRRAFHSGRQQQEWLIEQLAGRIPVQFIVANLEPDLPAFRLLRQQFAPALPPAEQAEFLQAYISAAEATARASSGDPAARAWLESCQLRTELGDRQGALEAIRQAAKCDTSLYQVHFYLAKCLLECDCYSEAREQIDWCLSRKWNDPGLRQMRDRAVKAELGNRRI